MPSGSDVSDPTGSIGAMLADLSARIKDLEDRVDAGDKAVREFANSIADERVQMAVQMRFISCMTWPKVAEYLGISSDKWLQQLVSKELGLNGIQLRIDL